MWTGLTQHLAVAVQYRHSVTSSYGCRLCCREDFELCWGQMQFVSQQLATYKLTVGQHGLDMRVAMCVMQAYCQKHKCDVHIAADVGCAGGDSSRRLAARFPDAQLTGVDLSPYFLALAELRQR